MFELGKEYTTKNGSKVRCIYGPDMHGQHCMRIDYHDAKEQIEHTYLVSSDGTALGERCDLKQNIYHQKLVDKLKPLRSKEIDYVWINFDDFRIKFILPPSEESPLYKFMIFKYRGKLRIAPYEYGKDPCGARCEGLILKDRLIAVSDTFFRIKNEQKKTNN